MPSTVDTYADYTLMFERAAGQHWNATQAEGQWAWEPQSATESRIRWGHPHTWASEPHQYKEHFRRDGDWVMLDGWEGNGTFYELDAAVQWTADGDLVTNRVALPPGAQHYAKWTVPPPLGGCYGMFALGTIVEQSSGKRVAFAHEQRWTNVGVIASPHLPAAPALRQTEKWWDDNGHAFSLRVHRDVFLAKGYGMAYRIQNYDPASGAATTRLDLKHAWTY
ncbi:hypothetical protein [Prauserella endophytica]|uniref:Uncharacterized protein n=1 Tax=Prauserella endophytica TaxID=1592324 RepID=A0ABY2S1G2_9PSEU|nr:hypothetical protein [Prauserella endophytica]PXY20305.1 hypothetical protein BAY59_31185 [Prauserella coralliicola]TKG66908.1 hypothetical protein FCN18_23630 [Prauserella endophytica]